MDYTNNSKDYNPYLLSITNHFQRPTRE